MFKNKRVSQFWLAASVSLCTLATTCQSQAEIVSDGTLSTEVTRSADNLNFTITGGSRAEGNLFHSFREFSVPENGSAIFNNALDVQNIISRVTGGSVSDIKGSIQAQGSANLFLLNPNGIIFGSKASLNIGGSFLASTASSIKFTDGISFSATDPQAQPLLTISVPIGLQFGKIAGIIRNQSQATRSVVSPDSKIIEVPVGLEVQSGKTLALVGSGVFLENTRMVAPGGRIELGSVTGSSIVSLTPIATGWALGYEGVQNFQDIRLSHAVVSPEGESLGDIQLRGKQIEITERSQVGGLNFGVKPGGTLTVKASESVEVSGISSLNTIALSTGASGDIEIETRQLIVREGSFIDTSSNDDGQGGDLTVNASESVKVNDSRLSTQAFRDGNAGDLTINTGKLILENTAELKAETFSGDGGNIKLKLQELLQLQRNSLISTTAGTRGTSGNGGDITIDTDLLVGLDNSDITANAFEGEGGFIQITAQGIFGLEVNETNNINKLKTNNSSDISASSQKDPSLNGEVKINRPENDPSSGLVALPAELVDVSGLIAQDCSAGGGTVARESSKFIATGRGGLPPTPTEALRSDTALADLGTTVQGEENRASAATSSNLTNSKPTPLVEAQGWMIGSKGEVVLIAQAPTVTPHLPWLPPTSCNGS